MRDFFDAQTKILDEIEGLSGADRLDYLAHLARQDMTTAPEGAARWQILQIIFSAIDSALVSQNLRLSSIASDISEAQADD